MGFPRRPTDVLVRFFVGLFGVMTRPITRVMTPTKAQLLALVQRLTDHSREMEAANSAINPGYAIGWRSATNTAIVAIWGVINEEHDLPRAQPPAHCGVHRRHTDTCPADCVYRLLPGGLLPSLRPAVSVDEGHDRELCDCLECENWRRAEDSHHEGGQSNSIRSPETGPSEPSDPL